MSHKTGHSKMFISTIMHWYGEADQGLSPWKTIGTIELHSSYFYGIILEINWCKHRVLQCWLFIVNTETSHHLSAWLSGNTHGPSTRTFVVRISPRSIFFFPLQGNIFFIFFFASVGKCFHINLFKRRVGKPFIVHKSRGKSMSGQFTPCGKIVLNESWQSNHRYTSIQETWLLSINHHKK